MAEAMRKSVAVIIPYYNGARYIERAIRSVLEQTVPADEFLIIDDGSSESEHEALLAVAEPLGVRVLRKENGGQGSARNLGVASTRADYICFLDQDDFFLHHHIALLIEQVRDQDPHFGWAYGDLMEADEDGHVIASSIAARYSAHPKHSIEEMLERDMHILPSASIISRRAFEAVGGFDTQFMGYEDDDLFLRIFREGYTNYFFPEAVTVWCINKNSTSYSIRMSRSRMRYIRKLCKMFSSDPERLSVYMRDLVFPRFMTVFAVEAFKSIYFERSEHERRMATHRDELVAMVDEFTALIQAHTRLRIEDRFKSRLIRALLRPRSRRLLVVPYAAARVLRRMKLGFRRR
ncbi:glycosyltransferase family 2 protein [Asaia krungthepensis]|uniref:Glycosyltransferase n=1 Tax=Asaia krungthepensis NRIC 0535 TaxID=1307925 RepID=A0ABQ0PW79_9PROT|nr:glycosyltransferase family A protein [Asaia krungthepensis]GBQ83178.1 glycosyltransferase [Asaia krungthepensis NRIC 0535]